MVSALSGEKTLVTIAYAPYSNKQRDITPLGWFARYLAILVREIDFVKTKTIALVKNCRGKPPIANVYLNKKPTIYFRGPFSFNCYGYIFLIFCSKVGLLSVSRSSMCQKVLLKFFLLFDYYVLVVEHSLCPSICLSFA